MLECQILHSFWRPNQFIDTADSGQLCSPDILQLSNGNVLLTWATTVDAAPAEPPQSDILAQLFDPAGDVIGERFILNTRGTNLSEGAASIAALPDGGFVAAYEQINANATSIFVERYDAAGNSLSDRTFLGDTLASLPSFRAPQLAVSSDTSAAIAYEKKITSTDIETALRIWNPQTNAISAEVILSSSVGFDRDPSITVLENGNYVVAWHNPSGTAGGIEARIIQPDGTPLGANFVVSGTYANTGFDDDPAVGGLTGGGFVIAWVNNVSGDDQDVLYTLYSANGTPIGGEARIVRDTASNTNSRPEVVGLEDGGFHIIYTQSTNRHYIQRFDEDGDQLGGIIRIAQRPSLDDEAVLLDDGRVAIASVEDPGQCRTSEPHVLGNRR